MILSSKDTNGILFRWNIHELFYFCQISNSFKFENLFPGLIDKTVNRINIFHVLCASSQYVTPAYDDGKSVNHNLYHSGDVDTNKFVVLSAGNS